MQKSLNNFQAEQCLPHVCFVAEYRINFSKSLHREEVSAGSSSLLFRTDDIFLLPISLNLLLQFITVVVSWPMSSSSDPTSKSWFVLELLLFLLSEGSVVSSKGLPEDLFLAFPLPDLPAIGKMCVSLLNKGGSFSSVYFVNPPLKQFVVLQNHSVLR